MTADKPTISDRLDALADEIGDQDPISRRATLLVAIAHDTRDRDVWGGDRAITWWERFPDKIRAGCYGGPTLAHWWERMCRTLGCTQPRRIEDRQALAAAISAGDDQEVLTVLRTRPEALALRVRLSMPTRPKPDQTDRQESLL